MRATVGEVLLEPAQLHRLLRSAELGPLGLVPDEVAEPSPEIAEAPAWLDVALRALRDPRKRIDFQSMYGERMVTRGTYAWGTDERVFGIVDRGSSYRLFETSPTGLLAQARGFLAIGRDLEETTTGFKLSAEAALVWLAVVDQMYGERLDALVDGRRAMGLIDTGVVSRRLNDAMLPDVRWPLSFLSRVMPRPAGAMVDAGRLDALLGELEGVGLLEPLDPSGGVRGVFELSEVGSALASETLAAVATMALGVSEKRSDGRVGHEFSLYVRSPNRIVFCGVGAGKGIVAAPDNAAVVDTLTDAFR